MQISILEMEGLQPIIKQFAGKYYVCGNHIGSVSAGLKKVDSLTYQRGDGATQGPGKPTRQILSPDRSEKQSLSLFSLNSNVWSKDILIHLIYLTSLKTSVD